MKVLLINPPATYVNEISQKCFPPVSLLYLAAALEEAGIEVALLDANARQMDSDAIVESARAQRPGLIGLPVFSLISQVCRRLLDRLKGACPDARFVVGGAEASAIPEQTLTGLPAADYLLRGEAESSLVSLCRAMQGEQALELVPGLHYREDDSVCKSRVEPTCEELGGMAPPARHLLEAQYRAGSYYSILKRERPVDGLISSRGCPFKCRFCYNVLHRYRARDPEDVVAEIHSIAARGVRDIEILDDSFTIIRSRAMRIFALIIREGLAHIAYRIKSRVDVVDAELLALARQAGVYQVSYGTESGSDRILERMGKRIRVADTMRALALTKEAGIRAHTSFIIGFPGETRQTLSKTVALIKAARPYSANLSVLIPYPQTAVYEEAKAEGTLVGDWSTLSNEIPWVKLPWIRDISELHALRRRALADIYLRPYYVAHYGWNVLRNLNMPLLRYAWQELGKTIRSS